LVDFICHGVTSPLLFKAYIRALEEKRGSPVRAFRFRDKVKVGHVWSLGHSTAVFEDGSAESSECDLYLRAYQLGVMQRSSCEACAYANLDRTSDITLGDFWGIEEAIPALRDESQRGVSLILANTERGRAVCQRLTERMQLTATELTYARNGTNRQLESPVGPNEKKRRLYDDIAASGITAALARALGFGELVSMRYRWFMNRLKGHMPLTLYRPLVLLKRAFRITLPRTGSVTGGPGRV
jgi:hypothetical protein